MTSLCVLNFLGTHKPHLVFAVKTGCDNFLRDHVANGNISLSGVRSEDQLADIFTKPLDEATFSRLRSELNVIDASNVL